MVVIGEVLYYRWSVELVRALNERLKYMSVLGSGTQLRWPLYPLYVVISEVLEVDSMIMKTASSWHLNSSLKMICQLISVTNVDCLLKSVGI